MHSNLTFYRKEENGGSVSKDTIILNDNIVMEELPRLLFGVAPYDDECEHLMANDLDVFSVQWITDSLQKNRKAKLGTYILVSDENFATFVNCQNSVLIKSSVKNEVEKEREMFHALPPSKQSALNIAEVYSCDHSCIDDQIKPEKLRIGQESTFKFIYVFKNVSDQTEMVKQVSLAKTESTETFVDIENVSVSDENIQRAKGLIKVNKREFEDFMPGVNGEVQRA